VKELLDAIREKSHRDVERNRGDVPAGRGSARPGAAGARERSGEPRWRRRCNVAVRGSSGSLGRRGDERLPGRGPHPIGGEPLPAPGVERARVGRAGLRAQAGGSARDPLEPLFEEGSEPRAGARNGARYVPRPEERAPSEGAAAPRAARRTDAAAAARLPDREVGREPAKHRGAAKRIVLGTSRPRSATRSSRATAADAPTSASTGPLASRGTTCTSIMSNRSRGAVLRHPGTSASSAVRTTSSRRNERTARSGCGAFGAEGMT
jgi:hypothetical protein